MILSASTKHGHGDVTMMSIFRTINECLQGIPFHRRLGAHCRLLTNFEFQNFYLVSTAVHQVQVRIRLKKESTAQPQISFWHL